MNIKTTLPISEARKQIFNIATDVQRPNRHYTLTENGRPKAVVLSAEEYESLIESVDILNNVSLMKKIKQGQAEYKKGQYVSLETILLKGGYLNVQNKISKFGSKRTAKAR